MFEVLEEKNVQLKSSDYIGFQSSKVGEIAEFASFEAKSELK